MMSIKITVEVSKSMRDHVKRFTEKFINEVVLNAELSPREVYILMYLYRYRAPKSLWMIYGSMHRNISSSTVDKALRKLYSLGLIQRRKDKKEGIQYYVESDLPCQRVKSVEQTIC